MYKITIYTDGACSGNPGKGGWAAMLIYKERVREISGAEIETTNNKMELRAVIEALKCLKYESEVTVYSDSAYIVNAIALGWLESWKTSNWIGSNRKPIQNKELWVELNTLLDKHHVNFQKVQGHSDNTYNNRCDALARAAIKTL